MRSRFPKALFAALLTMPVALQAQVPPAPLQDPNAPEQPFDPYHAEKSIEIGTYYLKKGNYDAAIERFQEAARLKPNFARPHLLLGEAYEKKGDKPAAIKSYQRYLEIVPQAPDAKKVRKRMEKLSREVQKTEANRRPG